MLAFQVAGCAARPPQASLRLLHAFNGGDGAWPRGSFVVAGDTLFGRTAVGGNAGNGTVFSIRADGSEFRSLYSFSAGGDNGTGNQPHHNSMLFLDEAFVGAALYGGNTEHGGAHTTQVVAGAEKSGNGTIFRVGADGDYRLLRGFDGGDASPANPHSPPQVAPDGSLLVGMTAQGGNRDQGALYAMKPDGSELRILHHFEPASGAQPHGVVAFDGDALLGMTRIGGTRLDGSPGAGVVFRFDRGTRNYTQLHVFAAGDPDDGDTNDHGFLTRAGDHWYGTTSLGGRHYAGTLFRMRSDGSEFAILHSFGEGADGSKPFGSLVRVGEWLYGTTTTGGANGEGTVFRLRPSDLRYESLASFDRGTTGAYPEDNVVPAGDGRTLYGMTQAGGPNDPEAKNFLGTVFAITLPE